MSLAEAYDIAWSNGNSDFFYDPHNNEKEIF
jgi:hypothetical protein